MIKKLINNWDKIILFLLFIIAVTFVISAIPEALDQMYHENYEIPVQQAKEIEQPLSN